MSSYAVVWKSNPVAKQVKCCTIQSFKGLESSVIILAELGHIYPDKINEMMYVAMSRAKDYLIVIGQLPD